MYICDSLFQQSQNGLCIADKSASSLYSNNDGIGPEFELLVAYWGSLDQLVARLVAGLDSGLCSYILV